MVVVVLVAAGTWNYLQPVPAVAASTSGLSQYVITGTPPTLPWPNAGSAAVGASGVGLIATSGDQSPAPAASVAKVMTALVVLADKPLAVGGSGPTLIMTDQDVSTYTADAADQQSVVPVVAGEQLSEFQALEALLIPSGNNIAETLARWDAGSVAAFVAKMNQRGATLHMTRTTFADPAGASTQTVSTPTDLLALGTAAMQQDVVAQIVGLPQTTLPVAGTVYNVNAVLGQSGIIGIKTGSGFGAGATFLFAAAATADGRPLTIFGCVMGQPTLAIAFDAAQSLIGTMQSALKMRPIVSSGDVVGAYATAWGSRANLVATSGLTLVEWPGMILRERLDTKTLAVDGAVASGTPAGSLHLVLGDQRSDVPLVTAGSLDPPGLAWRLSRINW
ncbi:MAG: D-alanyl-D-alanine carboxypeptidase family protein [Candidatus Dormibacteraceae bacterium]